MASRSSRSMIVSILPNRKSALAAGILVVSLALAGCGGDDEEEPSVITMPYTEAVPDGTTSEAEPSAPNPETETLPNDGDGTPKGENGPGGAGDEEPARTLALFTGENGRITPRVVRVPAFISIRVELRSADGTEYGLTFEGEAIKVSGGLASVSTTIDGLRPGAKVVGTPTGASGNVRIEATAEPGP